MAEGPATTPAGARRRRGRSRPGPACESPATIAATPRRRARTHRRRARGCPRTAARAELEPRAAAAVLVAYLDGHGARNPVGAQQHDVEGVAGLPGEALLGVIGAPHVERRERVDAARVGDREWAATSAKARMRTRSGCGILLASARCAGGSPSAQTPSSSARWSSGWCDRERVPRAGGRRSGRGRSGRARARSGCRSRIPPLRSVISCSPSARARTVTAHSLKAIGIKFREGRRCGINRVNRGTTATAHGPTHFTRSLEIPNFPAFATYFAAESARASCS